MRAGKHPVTGETEIYLTEHEAEMMKEMVRSTHLPIKRAFTKLLELI